MDPRDPLLQPHLAHHPSGHAVGPVAGREHPDRPGPLQGEARAELAGPGRGREDPRPGVCRVFGSDAEEPEGGF